MAAVLFPQTNSGSTTVVSTGGGRDRSENPRGTRPDSTVDVPWGSILVGCLALFIVLATFTLASGRGDLANVGPTPRPVAAVPGQATVTVRAGDSLWSIARDIQPQGDPRHLVDQLVAINGDGVLVPGQIIRLPG